MKKILLAVIALLSGVTIHAQHVWSYDECVEYAVSHNIDIQQRAVDIELQANQLNTIKNDWLPRVSVNGAQRFSFGNAMASTGTMATSARQNHDLSYTNAVVELDMPVFDGFKRINQQRAAEWSVKQATAQLASSRKSLSFTLATYYLQALYEKGMMEVAENQVSTSRQMRDKTKAFVDDGRNPQSDLANAEAQLADDEFNLTKARGRYQIALLNLSQLLNLESVEGFQIADITDESVLSQEFCNPFSLYSDVVDNYPSIVAEKAKVEKSRYDIAVARAGYYPRIDFRATLNSYYLNLFHVSHDEGLFKQMWNNKSEVIGLHFNIPVFDHFQTRNNIRKAKMTFTQSNLALDDAKQKLRKEINQAYYNALDARDKFVSAKKSQSASQLSCNFEQEKYEAGRSTSFDLAQATQRLRKASEDAVQAKYEYIIRMKILNIYSADE